jgi:hypothetical protein
MDIEELTEGNGFEKIKDGPKQESPDPEIKPEKKYHSDIADSLEGDIRKEEPIKTAAVNADDFTADFSQPSEPAAPDRQEPEKKNPVTTQPTGNDKNAAAARLFKPDMVMQMYNAITGRIGKVINSKNPDCLKFNKEDTDDIGVLLKNTAEEENWSQFPTKWLLIFLVGLILVGKIIMWNKPPKEVEANTTNNNLPNPEQIALIETLQSNIKELQEQNKMMQQIIDAGMFKKKPDYFEPEQREDQLGRYYKGYDMEKISFTENGALIDPDKAGTKGYTDEGKKMGIVSQDVRDIHKNWKIYQELKETTAV